MRAVCCPFLCWNCNHPTPPLVLLLLLVFSVLQIPDASVLRFDKRPPVPAEPPAIPGAASSSTEPSNTEPSNTETTNDAETNADTNLNNPDPVRFS